MGYLVDLMKIISQLFRNKYLLYYDNNTQDNQNVELLVPNLRAKQIMW